MKLLHVGTARSRLFALATGAIAVLAVSLLVPPAAADTADPAPASAADIPTPDAGDYLGSVGEDEADPGAYSATVDGFEAATLRGFDAGNLISNATLYTSRTMSAKQIQYFLNQKVPSCEKGYTCLKDFSMKTVTKKPTAYCRGTYRGSAKDTAAQIISKVAKACTISEKVLLVMLQKEQGLVTHVWPSSWRYDYAMGFACPDDAGCDARYKGFQNQMYMAASQLQRYTKDDYFSWYPVGKKSSVRYHPNPACGSSKVLIQNAATAALYYYTPYQPNKAALAAGYGTGDACSAYGNRNFYNYYTDWFGSTRGEAAPDPRNSVPVHRFWSEKFDNAHFYTVNSAEADKLRAGDANWTYEGRDFRVWPVSGGSCRTGTVPVYRFWSSAFESHFYTTNAAEKNDVRRNDPKWAYEGVGFCSATASQPGAVPVHRFWSSRFGKHFYTSNRAEMRDLKNNDPNWAYEGVGMYAPTV